MKTFPKPLSASEEKEYLERCKEGDEEAKNILILRNMRLVAHVVKKYQNVDYDMEDLISVGRMVFTYLTKGVCSIFKILVISH